MTASSVVPGRSKGSGGIVPPIPPGFRGKLDSDFPVWCDGCRTWQPSSEFAIRSDGYRRKVCRTCFNRQRRERYAADPEFRSKIRAYQADYYTVSAEIDRERRRRRHAADADSINRRKRERYDLRKQDKAAPVASVVDRNRP